MAAKNPPRLGALGIRPAFVSMSNEARLQRQHALEVLALMKKKEAKLVKKKKLKKTVLKGIEIYGTGDLYEDTVQQVKRDRSL